MIQKDTLKPVDELLHGLTDALRRAKVAKSALEGFCAINGLGSNALTSSAAELELAANQLSERSRLLLLKAESLGRFFSGDGELPANNSLAHEAAAE